MPSVTDGIFFCKKTADCLFFKNYSSKIDKIRHKNQKIILFLNDFFVIIALNNGK